jgi:hypothetical protein
LGFTFDQFDLLDEAELLTLIEKLDMNFANLKTDPRDIWGIEIPGHVPTIMIIKDNEVVKTMITPQTYEILIRSWKYLIIYFRLNFTFSKLCF